MFAFDNKSLIQLGDYVILQRQKYMKLVKFSNLDSTVMLGNEKLELSNILHKPYFATFKMCPKFVTHLDRRQRSYTLELCNETEMRDIREILGICSSGTDNRHVNDIFDSQCLKSEDIRQLREECNESTKIIEKIVENSKTFHAKTEYSQEKYLRKKEKKYFEYVQIKRPTIRLLSEVYYRQSAEKVLGIRMDILAQIISCSGICAYGNYLMYDSGTSGLLPAAFLNSMGFQTDACLVHMHPGNIPQKQAILALNLPDDQLRRCISVNIYSVLREYYNDLKSQSNCEQSTSVNEPDIQPNNKKIKLTDIIEDSLEERSITESSDINTFKVWQLENNRACALMREGFDALVVVAKEHPVNVVEELLQFVKPSRPIVVFSLCREVLVELYMGLKSNAKAVNLHINSNWMRTYQVLENRTHPEVNMQSNSGYLLTAYTIAT